MYIYNKKKKTRGKPGVTYFRETTTVVGTRYYYNNNYYVIHKRVKRSALHLRPLNKNMARKHSIVFLSFPNARHKT